tara:strand:+ start:6276 stop:6554 length:279 start_codon:yes stop_codon:yes gene_type:complete
MIELDIKIDGYLLFLVNDIVNYRFILIVVETACNRYAKEVVPKHVLYVQTVKEVNSALEKIALKMIEKFDEIAETQFDAYHLTGWVPKSREE